jgi:hypothetical protein
MAERLQLATDFGEVIDFAVENDRDGVVAACHRLRAARDVNDGEAAMTKANAGSCPNARSIWPPVDHRIGHGTHARRINWLWSFEMKKASYPAHVIFVRVRF